MNVHMLAIFALGAGAGYAVHREPAAPTAPVAQPPAPVAPPARVIVVQAPPAPPPVVEIEQPQPSADVKADPSPAEPAEEPKGTLQGTVTDSQGNPLYNVLVVADSPVGAGQAYTSSDGSYRIDNLPGASYRVEFSRYGEQLVDRSVGVSVLDPVELDVTLPD